MKNLLINLLSIIILTGCSDFLDIPAPKNELVTGSVFTNSATANSAMISIYSRMENEKAIPYYLSLYTSLSGDELTNNTNIPDLTQFYTNSLSTQNGAINTDIWQPAYTYIYQANLILEAMKGATSLPEKLVDQLTGEALFIRCFWYFHLVNLFHDVPLVLSTDYNVNSKLSRSTPDVIYSQIKSDLNKATTLLSISYIGADGSTSTDERVRPNKWAAHSLLARSYLYTNDYSEAEAQASKVLQNTDLYSLSTDLNSVFKKNSTETIWALQPFASNGFNTPEGNMYILTGPPSMATSANCATISAQLLSAFEPNDKRYDEWVGNFETYYFPYKYKIQTEVSLVEYSIVIRLAEMYLIRAEARVQQNNLSGALSDLNTVRRRAGLGDYNSDNRDSVLNAIIHERQVELFCEWGHRWFDLKRTNNASKVMPAVSEYKGGTWSNYKNLYPIPQTERENNSNLSQNDGY